MDASASEKAISRAAQLNEAAAEQKIRSFLNMLARKVGDLAAVSQKTSDLQASPLKGSLTFSAYTETRSLASERWAFSIVIERRIDLFHGARREDLVEQFHRLTVSIWVVLLKTSLIFHEILSKERRSPLGPREVFISEVKTLYDSHRLLSRPEHRELMDDSLLRDQQRAGKILDEVIERAPMLLDFDS